MKEVLKNNKLIAEFMNRRQRKNGLQYTFEHPIFGEIVGDKIMKESSYIEKNTYGTVNNLLYHKSWDWLMPVVEKLLSRNDVYLDSYRKTNWWVIEEVYKTTILIIKRLKNDK